MAYKGQVYYDENDQVTVGTLVSSGSAWYNYHQFDAEAFNPGASGATQIPPDANTLGGYRLDNSGGTEYLYFSTDIHSDWDGSSDIEVDVRFEINAAGSLGTDTVDLRLQVFMKGLGESANRSQVLEEAIVVGAAAQYTSFEALFTIDYDDLTDPVASGDVMSFILNLETDTSEVDNVIINHAERRYKSKYPRIEV